MITQTLEAKNQSGETGYLSWKTGGEFQVRKLNEFTTVGRDTANHVPIDDDYTSQRHFRIECKPNGYLLRDLKSRNGTFLNGVRVYEALLKDGDRITLGRSDLFFSCKKPHDNGAILTSRNSALQEQLNRLGTIAQSSFPILISGPSGSGKDVLAHAIHRLSHRNQGPFVGINCSALSESLVESELFGHVKGSFTGATGDRKGAFESARGGTLFLDEIGDLPLALQPKLLRALENREIQPVGSDRRVETDVRIVAATHQNLKTAVNEGRFRADLYFRLHVVQIKNPSLVERMEDFEDLLYKFAKEYRVRFSHTAIQEMKSYRWPGNIRELKNVVARARALFEDQEIQASDVGGLIDSPLFKFTPNTSAPQRNSTLKDIELEIIKQALVSNMGNQRRAAAALGLPKSTLHDRIRTHGIIISDLLAERVKV